MTYNEFKEIDKGRLGYLITEDEDWVYVNFGLNNRTVITISKTKMNSYSIDVAIESEDGDRLIRAVLALAGTPLDKREPEKKYCLKYKFLGALPDVYLNLFSDGKYVLLDAAKSAKAQTKFTLKATFTLKEIEDIKNKFGMTLSDFEMIEVKQ